MRLIAALCVMFAVAACDRQETSEPAEQVSDSAEPVQGLDRTRAGQPMPGVGMTDAQGEAATLASATGEPLLVNLWATWCAPCVTELPTLEALSERAGAPRVIAISQDMAPRGSVDAFVDRLGLGGLEVWHDPQMALSGELGAQVLPTTILYDAQGREVWRYVGDLDWSGEEAARLLDEVPAAASS